MKRNLTPTVDRMFNKQRRVRPHRINHFGGFKAGKLHPLAVTRFDPDEAGTVSVALDLLPAPVNGYMRSKAYAEVVQVFVPYQAIEKLDLATQEDAGVTEMTRRRLLAKNHVGYLEDENAISQAAFVHPRSVGGAKRVSRSVRLAYLCAVNYLRRMAYFEAQQLDRNYTAIAPAVLTANVLQRFNGVLDPEKLIDGAINLTGDLPVRGIIRLGDAFGSGTADIEGDATKVDVTNVPNGEGIRFEIDPNQNGITADLSGAGEITLRDMMESKLLDQLVRKFARMVQDDPLHGETAVARAIYGLQVDFDDDCQKLYHKVHEMTPVHMRPTDGASMNDVQAQFRLNTKFTTLVPRSELGGQVVTLVAFKPLETLTEQPDPHQTRGWWLENRVTDELQLEEVLLTRADLESELAAVDEDTPVFWTGHNRIRHGYMSSGPNKHQTNLTEQKSSMWIYPVPSSVTPQNVSYPENYGELAGQMYPFANWAVDHCEYSIDVKSLISTPLNLGPNPVEKLQLFADDPTLVGGA